MEKVKKILKDHEGSSVVMQNNQMRIRGLLYPIKPIDKQPPRIDALFDAYEVSTPSGNAEFRFDPRDVRSLHMGPGTGTLYIELKDFGEVPA
jgi:hypothetical protein